MVGIVIVSHSGKVAQGAKEIAMQMADEKLKMVAAGGLGDGSIGTDAAAVYNAVMEADSGEGVLVTADLGSAVLSAETALSMLGEKLKSRVAIADAPVVEGTIAAAVTASAGAPLTDVKAAAEEARDARKLD
jgi:dihydroxyacetone kinase phosphotransfer subunit